MRTGKTIGGVAAMVVIGALLHGVALYAATAGNESLPDTETHQYAVAADPCLAADHEDPEDYVWDSSQVIPITLDGTTITTTGFGAAVDGSTVTLFRGGTYSFSGALTDGQIVVDSQDKKIVRLILDEVDIRCSFSAPILVENAKKTVIVLAEDSNNYVAQVTPDATAVAADEPNAAIFSKDDLTLWGGGTLTIQADVNDGISSKNGLVIAGGTIGITATDDGIRGKDYLVVRGGDLTVKAGGTGLKADNDTDATKGYVSLESGTVRITSKDDAIKAETDVLVAGGSVTSTAGGGSANARVVTNAEAKGIVAGVGVVVDGGTVTIDSADDAVHSNGTLAVNGGTLVLSTMADAIHSSSTIDVNNGDIRVNRSYEGIDSNTITLSGGAIKIVSSDDGIIAAQSLTVTGGVLTVTSTADAVSAETDLHITGGTFTLTSGGGSAKTATTVSAKGLKAGGNVVVDGGTFTISSADDAINANADVTINGGALTLASGDDGIHANANLVINNGDVRITKSYEGLESFNASITLNGGTVHLVSSDDGINVSAGGDTMGQPGQGGMPGQGGVTTPTTASTCWLNINGGTLVVDAQGDGLDSNGSISMTDGLVLVSGPTGNDNGALDYGTFPLTGGFLVAAGSSGMAMAPGTNSTQYSVLVTFSTTQAAKTLFHIQDSAGQDIVTFAPNKQYNSVAFSSPKLVKGGTYDVYYGGSSTGTLTDGLYQGGVYTAGTKFMSFTISTVVTNVGGAGGGTNPGGGTTPPTPGGRR